MIEGFSLTNYLKKETAKAVRLYFDPITGRLRWLWLILLALSPFGGVLLYVYLLVGK